MAMGDFGVFSPAESLYTKPGAADEAARASVIKRASYLSQMDQFYANLEESVRQYNKTYKLQKADLALRTKEQADVSAYRQESLDVQREQIAAQSDWYAQQYELGLKKIESGETIARLEAKTRDPNLGSGPLVPAEAQFQHTSDLNKAKEGGSWTSGQIPLSWLESQLGGTGSTGTVYNPYTTSTGESIWAEPPGSYSLPAPY